MARHGNASSLYYQDKMRKLEREQTERIRTDLRAVMATQSGRRFLWDLIDGRCGTISGTFTGNSETFYREGRRSIGIELLSEAQAADRKLYVEMFADALRAKEDAELIRKNAELDSAKPENSDE